MDYSYTKKPVKKLKQLTIDFDQYNEELKESFEAGRSAALNDIEDLFRLIFVKCDREDAWWKCREIFSSDRADVICEYLNIQERK